MKRLIVIFFLCSAVPAFSQSASEVIQQVIAAQKKIQNVSYSLRRTDTLVTGHVRSMSGQVKMTPNTRDTLWGFNFYATKDGETGERIYDGYQAYSVGVNGTYTATPSAAGIRAAVYSGGGGHLVMPDLIRIDTANSVGVELSSDQSYYFLKFHYADYQPEDVTRRYKLLAIDRKLMLPVSMRNHQETYGKVQDLFYEITAIKINAADFNYDFSNLPFLSTHTLAKPANAAPLPIYALLGKEAPAFKLSSFDGTVLSSDFKAKVTLIDLWEVWCGPCIAAMPKIEALKEKYAAKGLQVLGITSDPRSLDAGRTMVKRRGTKLTMLIGDKQFRDNYHAATTALPMYILIDKNGRISYLAPGFTEDIEREIVKLLN